MLWGYTSRMNYEEYDVADDEEDECWTLVVDGCVESGIDVSAPQGGKSTQQQRLRVDKCQECLPLCFVIFNLSIFIGPR